MYRITVYPVLALPAVALLAMACGGSDQPDTTSSGAATPTVSAVAVTAPSETTSPSPAVTAPVTFEQAETAFQERRYPEAAQLFARYTESKPENPWGHYMLGLAAWKGGDHNQAAGAFDRALELDPDHEKSLFNSARVLLEMDRPQPALERIEKALAREPGSNEGLRLLGRARYELGQVEEAIDAYRRALAVNQRDVWSMNNLGLILVDQGRSSEALPPLALAVELDSTSPVFQNNLGIALERAGYPSAAAQAYEAAISADSSYHKASVSLARVTAHIREAGTESVDLTALAQEFRDELSTWSTSNERGDSLVEITGLSDSSRASLDSIQEVGDSTNVGVTE